jgi:dihydroflavonol-4-reductase
MSNFWRDRRVLVTGGSGFLGAHLCQQLLDAGAAVRSFSLPLRERHPFLALPVENHWGDIRDADAVQKAIAGCDIVFHAAGPVAVWGPGLEVMHSAHRDGAQNVVNAAKSARVVHTSSIVAVGGTRGRKVLDETSPFTMCTKIDYVHAKRRAEEIALDAAQRGRDVVVVNPGYLVGPDDFEPSVMGKFCTRVWKGKISAVAPGGYNLVDVRDVAAGHLLAAERGQSGRRYILGGENYSMAEVVRLLTAAAGLRPRSIPTIPLAMLWAAAWYAEARARRIGREPYPSFQHVRLNRYSWFVTSDRAKKELGYAPRALAESVRDTFAWYAQYHKVRWRGWTRWWLRPAA